MTEATRREAVRADAAVAEAARAEANEAEAAAAEEARVEAKARAEARARVRKGTCTAARQGAPPARLPELFALSRAHSSGVHLPFG